VPVRGRAAHLISQGGPGTAPAEPARPRGSPRPTRPLPPARGRRAIALWPWWGARTSRAGPVGSRQAMRRTPP